MKITVNPVKPDRKLVAVVRADGLGLFIRLTNPLISAVQYIGPDARLSSQGFASLERLLEDSDDGRTPVYEGDTITLQF